MLSSLISFIKPQKVKAAVKIEYKGAVSYQGSVVGDFRVNGVQAFCYQHSKKSPPTGTAYNEPSPYDNERAKRALYYGWGGDGNIFTNRDEGLVTTSLILDRIYSGGSSGKSLPKYDKLWDLVVNGEDLDTNVAFSDTNLSVSVKGNKQVSQTTTFKSYSENSVSIKVPKDVTIINETTGKKVTNGTMKVYGGEKIHLEASLEVGVNYSTGNIKGSMKLFQPLITKPQGGGFQVLGFMDIYTDPDETASFKAKFEVRKKNIDVTWKDKDSKKVFKHVNEDKTIGSKYKYTPPATFKDGDNTYERMTDKPFEGTVSKDLTHVFNYKLRRTVTVNYYDNRTGEKVKDTKKYTKLRGDKYSESHPTIKQDGYTMRYVKKTGDAESGTIGTKNITVNYYYDKPLAKVQLDKVQVYTARASEGMPVRVYLSKDLNYKSSVADMSKKKIAVGLYLNGDLIEKRSYTANSLPKQFDFKVPSSKLKINTEDRYAVKFLDYDEADFDIKDGYSRLALDGWSANEGTIRLDVEEDADHTGSKSYVVMTEITPTTNMKKYVERFTYSATPLLDSKSGYGVETDFQIEYTNDLGKDWEFATNINDSAADYYAPEGLLDPSLAYEITDGIFEAPLVKSTDNRSTASKKEWTDSFAFPHMNVERQTGDLFTDEEVEAGDSDIEHDLKEGGDKFYSPIWAEITDYDVQYKTNKMGANKMTVELSDNWNIYAQMIATMDSKTIDKDAILWIPVNKEDPFPNGNKRFTKEDIEWIKNN
ncbi:MucBP domain-containing protein [Terribacillus saccharophilus]